jgi:hypothetical protein
MPTAFEIVEEARGFADFFEQRWNLPWYTDKASASLWRHKLLQLIAHLPEGLFEDVVELLLADKSFALRGIALHLARVRSPSSRTRPSTSARWRRRRSASSATRPPSTRSSR